MSSITSFRNVDGYKDIATFSFVSPAASFIRRSVLLFFLHLCVCVWDSNET